MSAWHPEWDGGEPFDDAPLVEERAVVAACMADPSLFDALPPGFGPRHFTSLGHGRVFEVAAALAREFPGADALAPLVKRRGADAAAVDAIASGVVSLKPASVRAYAEAVMKAAQLRATEALGRQVAKDAASVDDDGRPADPVVLLERFRRRADEIEAEGGVRPQVTMDAAMQGAVDQGRAAFLNGGLSGMSVGFDPLDKRIGGLEPECVYIVAARPGVGKTALATQIILRTALRLKKEGAAGGIGVISLEMSAAQLGRRALSVASGVGIMDIKTGAFEEQSANGTELASKIVAGMQRYRELPILIEEEGRLPMEEVRRRAKDMARRLGGLKLLVIDHFHILAPPKGAGGNEQTAFAINSGLVKALAKEMKIPILLLAQLNRASEGREDTEPKLMDLRGSGALEQDADAVLFIHRPCANLTVPEQRLNEDDDEFRDRLEKWEKFVRENEDKAFIVTAKGRDAERGKDELRFDGPLAKFYDPNERWAA